MRRYRFLLELFLLLTALLIGRELLSMPSSSFIIIPSGITGSVYKESRTCFRVESSDEDFNLFPSANQKILSSDIKGDKRVITVSSGDTPLAGEKDLSKYLKNTPFLNIDNESIKKTAAGFKNSKDTLREVSLFVYRHITDKKIGIPLLPAVSILAGRSGDCTEHSVLTISILRALKIPSRAVMGIILSENFSGKQDVFVYHMWAEAFINGRWVLVDSTRPLDIHPNRYIALAYHNLMTETPMEYLQAISTIQDIRISVVK